MIWTDESRIVSGGGLPAPKPTRETKIAIMLICVLVIWIVLSLGSLIAKSEVSLA